jgi:hypothetical protein
MVKRNVTLASLPGWMVVELTEARVANRFLHLSEDVAVGACSGRSK